MRGLLVQVVAAAVAPAALILAGFVYWEIREEQAGVALAALLAAGGVVAMLLAASIALAWRLNRRILGAMGVLTRMAASLRHGEPVQAAPLAFDEASRLAFAFEAAAAEVQQANASLAASERRLRGILRSAMDAVITVDETQTVVLANEAAERMFGARPDALLGRPLAELLPERFRGAHAAHLLRYGVGEADARRMGADRIVSGLRQDGTEFPTEASISVTTDQDGRKLYTVIMRDVTEKTRDREALVRSNLELQQFAFVASHDLRTPLRTVKGYLQLVSARLGAAGEGVRPLIARADSAVDQLDRLTADLLAYARVTSGARPLELVDMQAVLGDVLAHLGASVLEKDAQVSAPEPLPVVPGDRTQLAQLLQNLVGNAIQYCERRPEVRVTARREGEEWLFCVADNGIGIEPRYLAKIFEPFERLHGAHEYPGTGIGLAVCRRVVERHGGRIWAESGPGTGSTFFFTLPRADHRLP